MHFIEFQIADIKDALAGLYGVVPKIQCLLPKVRGAVLSSVSSLRRRVPFPGSCVLCGVPGVELHVGTPWACAVCAYRHVLGMCRACMCVPVCAHVCICTGTYTGCLLCVHMCAFALGHVHGMCCVCWNSRLSFAAMLGQGSLSPDFPSHEGTFLEGPVEWEVGCFCTQHFGGGDVHVQS